ncbi:GNAT family N-acetyltransferase [Solitalea lacus]|uniref:GNAT family N-acetyltransferase n=1 Tax=Solitalea lacus TaxID=2911172 RepID=UPI001EDBB53A|nr:GNAT family N-acetyltransferase [Solitalea lacus]UKJ07381.1 GNAT family N-acetyltransferase [Solitalea lacus]
MEIRTLETTPVDTILNAFNYAFSDYLVPFQLTLQQLEDKMESEGTMLKYSVGMFDGEELVGFILHSQGEWNGKNAVYNGGTGVVPTHRGKGITQQLYQYIIAKLKEEGVHNHLLEYLHGNGFAQRIYEAVGFKPVRDLDCLRGKIEVEQIAIPGLSFKEIDNPDWGFLQTFFTTSPSWQNNIASIIRAGGKRRTIGVYFEENLVGFATFNPGNGRIALIAIAPAHRKKGYGTALLNYLQQQIAVEASIFNIDTSDESLIAFFKKRGLKSVVGQVEMEMTFSV